MFDFRADAAQPKAEFYRELLSAADALTAGEPDGIANMANAAGLIWESLPDINWVGFYRNIDGELVLGPFQGPVACTRIPFGKGVCGSSWQRAETIVVPDVEEFPGHIACSSESRSEIVVPVWQNGRIIAVLDIDSEHLGTFDATDKLWLEQIVSLIQ